MQTENKRTPFSTVTVKPKVKSHFFNLLKIIFSEIKFVTVGFLKQGKIEIRKKPCFR